ncbi:uncharacterized protein BXZ73DRAFT_49424, partial [Epithele typhae]|uniref:uncharacterized protein n=1 Tax=Epithele typhae TaxID=378194 RepID=UPI0020081BB6
MSGNPLWHQSHSTPAAGLWGHLLFKRGPIDASLTEPANNQLENISRNLNTHPVDKTGASTRMLLHDTHANLEKFTDRVTQLTVGLDKAKRELVTVQKLFQEEHEQLADRMIGLVNRCQRELQKTIGTPAQHLTTVTLSKDLAVLSTRMDAMDKKVDALSAV